MCEPCEKIRPCERTCVRIGHVDLDLRHDDEQGHRGKRAFGRAEQVLIGNEVHLRWLDGLCRIDFVLDGKKREECPAEHLQCAGNDPAWSCRDQRNPPAHAVPARARWQETQIVDLFADLHDHRQRHRAARAERKQIEFAVIARDPGEGEPVGECVRFAP